VEPLQEEIENQESGAPQIADVDDGGQARTRDRRPKCRDRRWSKRSRARRSSSRHRRSRRRLYKDTRLAF
jgi:hypothetical protein